GVVLTHGNLIANSIMIAEAFELDHSDVVVSWLPFYHDMGLIGGVLQALYLGARSILLPPQTIARPHRWLETITKFKATISPAPNFAFDMCTTRITEAQKANIDLSTIKVWSCGAEPVRFETLRSFTEAFAKQGASLSQFSPSYGLAEATLAVSMDGPSTRKTTRSFKRDEMRAGGRAVPVGSDDPRGDVFVGCGRPLIGQDVRILHSESSRSMPAFEIGEICVSGKNVARGYWNRPDVTASVFGFETEGRQFLKTGDLGFIDDRGILFVVGRIKEMIIVRGRNYYPHDLEDTCRAADLRLAKSVSAAFAVETEKGEGVVIVQEAPIGLSTDDLVAVGNACRGRISDEFELQVLDIRFVPPGGVPRTSSGKIRRGQARVLYSKDSLAAYDLRPLAAIRSAVTARMQLATFKTHVFARIALSRARSILPLSKRGSVSISR
ncbi:MAG: AMP-binding protein, partial [Bdellovibrionota bacterium]